MVRVDRGFLDLIGGSKLETVGRLIVPETGNFSMPKDAPKIDWIIDHWLVLLFESTRLYPFSR